MSGADALRHLREICLALPEAEERETWGDPNWRVRERIFALMRPNDEVPSIWMKAPPGAQELLVEADPERFFAPPYLGPKGWIAMRAGAGLDWSQAAAFIARSYGLVAPRRLARLVAGA